MIRQAHHNFEQIMQHLNEAAAEDTTAYQVEHDLFRALLSLGATLLSLFFVLRAQAMRAQPPPAQTRRQGSKKRRYFSLFGPIEIQRPYCYRSGGGSLPLDEALSLPKTCYSDLLREMVERFCVHLAYDKAAQLIEAVLGFGLSTRAMQQMVVEDAADVEAYYDQQSAPDPGSEAEILVVQADGKGVPMRSVPVDGPVRLGKGQKRTRKKEAVVTSLYSVAARSRSADEVVASFLGASSGSPSVARPRHKKLWATLSGKAVALDRLQIQVHRRNGDHITHRVALSDGCEALQRQLHEHFPRFTLILDFVHVSEYLWKAANALFEEKDPVRLDWVKARTEELLHGQSGSVIKRLRRASGSPVLEQVANYFARNAASMRYDVYLRWGWPIASGVIEGACRHLVKDRCEGSGMRWTINGAEQMLMLRAVEVNGDWADYHCYRRRQRHQRLYGGVAPVVLTPEEQVMRLAA
ncbi:MAG: ISKra4 family transposase [Candidatus Tectomicrobia bacterium]